MKNFLPLVLAAIIALTGCQTTQTKNETKKPGSASEAVTALSTVTEGLTNQGVSKQDLKNLTVQVQKDPQVKSAVQSINQALDAQQTGVKYCPVDGQRFDASVDTCPVHKVKLKLVE